MQSPMLRCPATKLELADKTQAVSCGGLAFVQQMVRQVGLAESINRNCPIFKLHMPYTEADHVLNIAFNMFAGGTCLEHLELRRNDEAYLDLLGAQRIPDPTTAGDFCRRFSSQDVDRLMDAINDTRVKIWQQQADSFFGLAVVEGDGTMIETTGEKKQGIGLNHEKQWGRHRRIKCGYAARRSRSSAPSVNSLQPKRSGKQGETGSVRPIETNSKVARNCSGNIYREQFCVEDHMTSVVKSNAHRQRIRGRVRDIRCALMSNRPQ